MHLAAQEGHEEVVRVLQKFGGSCDLASDDGTAPLHLATLGGHIDAIRALVRGGGSVNKKNRKGMTPALIAATRGHGLQRRLADGIELEDVIASLVKGDATASLYPIDKVVQTLHELGARMGEPDRTGAPPLYFAAANGNVSTALTLIKLCRANVNHADKEGVTPLYVAVQEGHVELVQELCRCGANPDMARKGGLTPSFLAASMGHSRCLDVLLRARANPDGQTSLRGLTALHAAAQLNHVDVIHALARAGAFFEAQNTEKMRPLYMAAVHNSAEAVDALLEYNTEVEARNKVGETALFGACLLGHTEAAVRLISAKACLRAVGPTSCQPLYAAAQNGHTEVVRACLARLADPTCRVERAVPLFNIDLHTDAYPTAAYVAAQMGHANIVQVLCRAKADLEIAWADGSCVAHIAASNGHVGVFRALQEGDLEIDKVREDGRNALHLACLQGAVEVVEALIDIKADVEAVATVVTCGGLGTRPALCAASYGHLGVLESLGKAKADLSAANSNGDTPAYHAAENGHAVVLRFLWNAKADMEKVSLRGASPLYIASQNGHLKAVRVLSMAQVDLNRMAFSAATPVAVAAQEGHLGIVKLLLRAKADPKAGVDGFNAQSAASQAGHGDVLESIILASQDYDSIMARATGTDWAAEGVLTLQLRQRWQQLVRQREADGSLGPLRLNELETMVKKRLRVIEFEARHAWTHRGAIKHHLHNAGEVLVDSQRFDEHEANWERDVAGGVEAAKRKFKADLLDNKLKELQRSGLQNAVDSDPQPESTIKEDEGESGTSTYVDSVKRPALTRCAKIRDAN